MGTGTSLSSYRSFGTVFLITVLLGISIAYIFYDSIWGILSIIPVYFVTKREYRKYRKNQLEERFQKEFKEFLMCINNGLQVGHSVENAFVDAEQELWIVFGEQGVMYRELREINHQVQMSVPIEKAFQMVCKRHPYEEVLAFAEIFEFGKRLGGDYGKNLRRTAEKINEKMALKQEIQALTAEKRLELLVMSVMPIGILLYMKIGTGEFMAPLYGNMFGVILMSAMLLLYFGMLKLGVFIIQVKM